MSMTDDLMTIARSYGASLGLELSTVSWRALGDTKKLAAIDAGSDIQVGRCEKTLQWFSDNWPANTDWPEGIERPSRSKAEAAS